ncbi:MAG: RagB/SusD family nutrient uptake outer membrane protein, partial [Bacteroidota bacterium]
MKIKILNKTLSFYMGVITTLLFGMTLNSCSQFDLDEDPGLSQLAVLPYESQAELELAVNGAYSRLHRALWMTTSWVSAWAGDDLTTHRASNKADFREYDQRDVTNGNARTRGTWNGMYNTIRAANTVLVNAAETNLSDRTAQDALVGEAYFIRGYCFHHLARVFGKIPLVLDIVPDPEIGLATQEQVYAQIESDYTMAESMLPVSSNIGATRPNKGTARAFLSRLYMDWAGYPLNDNGKYALAASSAKQ